MERVRQLLTLLSGEHFGQLLITDTQEDRMLSIISDLRVEFKHFKVEDGKLI
jgi:hypothetical protein